MEKTNDKQELAMTYLQEMLPTYVEGHGYEEHPLPEYYAIETAIDIMQKYQKIKNIICRWEVGIYDDEGLCHTEVLEMISDEVNGDGYDD